ncbi:hypothetical protein F5Y06DRAFT_308573 [Hypoxylon sp. FL0890]|nr:hypothetical protein F5Y06DRAFT_308573 [Hypoxylon sp. FL0890]
MSRIRGDEASMMLDEEGESPGNVSSWALELDESLLMFTPGFDDTTKSDVDIFEEITNFLATQYALGRS